MCPQKSAIWFSENEEEGREGGRGGAKTVWNFSENSSVLIAAGIPKTRSLILSWCWWKEINIQSKIWFKIRCIDMRADVADGECILPHLAIICIVIFVDNKWDWMWLLVSAGARSGSDLPLAKHSCLSALRVAIKEVWENKQTKHSCRSDLPRWTWTQETWSCPSLRPPLRSSHRLMLSD